VTATFGVMANPVSDCADDVVICRGGVLAGPAGLGGEEFLYCYQASYSTPALEQLVAKPLELSFIRRK
jgi:hypothetical protein